MASMVKTAILSPCYLEGSDYLNNDRMERNRRYLSYYSQPEIKKLIGHQWIYLVDNGSSKEKRYALMSEFPDTMRMFSCEHVPHGPTDNDYPYCWRALYHMRELIDLGYQKIVLLDSDGFVLSRRLATYLGGSRSGWIGFPSSTHQFMESSIQVLNESAFPVFLEYAETPWPSKVGVMMETDIPFTDIARGYNVGRFGEQWGVGQWCNSHRPQEAGMDWYGQASLSTALEFGKYD